MNNYIKKTIRCIVVGCRLSVIDCRSAFTLVELMVVVAISAVISIGGFLTIYKYQAAQNLKLAMNEIVAVARNIQEMSVTQKNGKQWGIRFSNSVANGQSFRTWSGSSFASSSPDQTYKLRTGVNFGNPVTNEDIDIAFSPISGEMSQNQIITLLAGSSGSTVGDIIVNTLGKVTTRREEGLVGYWHFDEGTSTIAYDNSGYGNNGTLYNNPTWQLGSSCKAGSCVSLNGSNYIESQNPQGFNFGSESASIVVWFKTTALSGALITKRISTGFQIYVLSTKLYADGAGTTGVSSNNAVNDGLWHQGVAVYDRASSLLRLYVDGQPDNTIALGSTSLTDAANLEIGRALLGGTPMDYCTGSVDEVRIYNRALSASEILQMYNDIK